MPRPRVAIVGSVDETRTYEPALTDPALARQACRELGRELAGAGWDIVVHSSRAKFVEADFVRGYVSADAAAPGSIHVHALLDKSDFAELDDHPDLFDVRADPGRDWEVSFYRTLANCDGVLLVGGGRATISAGLIALTLRVPVVALARFGGEARTVWEHMTSDKGDATDEDVAAMAHAWRGDSAGRMVGCLTRQHQARAARQRAAEDEARRESRRENRSLVVAVGLLAAAVAGLAVSWGFRPGTGGSIAALALVPAFAGAAGALIRTSLDTGRHWLRASVLGGAAGLLTGLLYVASQLVGAPDVLDSGQAQAVRRLLFFVLPIGFVAGLTFDVVYTKLKGSDVTRSGALDQM